MLKRIVAAAAAVLLALSLTACKTGGVTPNPQDNGLDGKAYTQQTFEGAMESGLLAPAVNSAGELVTVSQESGKNAIVTTYDAQGKKKGAVTTDVTDTVSRMALGPNDEVCLLAEPQGGMQTVHVLDASGKTAKSIALEGMKVIQMRRANQNGGNGANASASAGASTTPAPTAASGNGSKDGGFDIKGGPGGFNMRSQITGLLIAPDGSILATSLGSGILQFDQSGKQVKTIGGESMMSYAALDEKGQLLVYSLGQGRGEAGAAALKTYDIASGKEVANVEAAGMANMQALFYDKAGKRLLFMTDADVRALSSDGKTSTVLATFSDFSLLNGSRQITSFAVDGQGAVYLAAYNTDARDSSGGSGASTGAVTAAGPSGGGMVFRGGGDFGGGMSFTIGGTGGSANEMIRLGLVDASTIQQRQVITMAAINSSRVLNQAISAFQIANPGYKIELKVYNTEVQGFRKGSGQFDVTSLMQALNTDLMSGKGADIIVLDNLPYYKYVDKGLLVDLSQLMTDKQFDSSKYYSNIFDACKINGKLWGLPMSFSYSVLTGKSSTMPDSATPTLSDFIAKAKALPEGITPFARQDALQIFYSYMRYSYADLVDTTNHKANFDSPEFIQALKDFKDLIGENTSNDNNQGFQAEQLNGNVAYNIASMNNPMALTMQRAILGDDLKITNVPTLSGSASKSFTASLMLGINANSKNKDVAWQFIESMLGEDIQGSGRLDGYPVLKSASTSMIDDMKSGEGLGAAGRRMVLRIGDKEVEVKPLTDADYQAITDTLPTLNSLQAIDPNIQKVLSEELPTFFSGQKTAEEVAALIQNRVSLVINE